jgi:hypothetical protein
MELRALMYIFGLHPRPIPREQLYTLLWATLPDDQARRHQGDEYPTRHISALVTKSACGLGNQ